MRGEETEHTNFGQFKLQADCLFFSMLSSLDLFFNLSLKI